MMPNTFDSDVPPLNTKLFANFDSKSTASSQQTQKSFSMMTGETPRRIAACSKYKRRLFGGQR